MIFFKFIYHKKVACRLIILTGFCSKIKFKKYGSYCFNCNKHLGKIFYYLTGCKEGLYGNNCSQQCVGHCRDGGYCNYVNGRCDAGCVDGWTGNTCEKGKHYHHFHLI